MWWRWILVLPATIVGFGIAQVATIIVTLFVPEQVTQLVGSVVTPMGFIMLGARVAPSRKTQTAGILTILMLVWHGMIWALILFSGWYASGTKAFGSVAIVLGIIGSVAGLYVAYLQERFIERHNVKVLPPTAEQSP